ncbi:MAG TPA: GntR family transcriptional regulator [Flavisolibacter sp.]|nr:GntR family transcriptional regulator [Flavisolibacter sp.]
MKSDSLALKAYKELRKKILSQQLAPNTRLKEDEWALKVKVSRMAIREALNRLLGEGLLKVGEKGGYFVKPVTVEDVKQIRELREILELGAIRLAYEKITPAEINQLEKICDNFSMMAAEGYTSGACEADIKFHETLMKCAHNEKLLQLYITSHIPLFHEKMGKAMGTIDDHEQTDKEHRQIVKALKTKNLKLAEQTLTAHFARGVSAVLDIS